jgi:hypothetical protein
VGTKTQGTAGNRRHYVAQQASSAHALPQSTLVVMCGWHQDTRDYRQQETHRGTGGIICTCPTTDHPCGDVWWATRHKGLPTIGDTTWHNRHHVHMPYHSPPLWRCVVGNKTQGTAGNSDTTWHNRHHAHALPQSTLVAMRGGHQDTRDNRQQ